MNRMTVPVLLAVLAVVVFGAVVLLVLLGAWQRPARMPLSADGFQELDVIVRGRYTPDMVEAKRGIPVRLHFRREEDTPCSERVIFSDFHVGACLPAYRTTAVSFIPTKCGEFLFTCAFGMYQGRLVVVEPSKRDLERVRLAEPRNPHKQPPGLPARSPATVSFPPDPSNPSFR
jgi:Cu+-exporting ATPase